MRVKVNYSKEITQNQKAGICEEKPLGFVLLQLLI